MQQPVFIGTFLLAPAGTSAITLVTTKPMLLRMKTSAVFCRRVIDCPTRRSAAACCRHSGRPMAKCASAGLTFLPPLTAANRL
jgi:hypothetical protein